MALTCNATMLDDEPWTWTFERRIPSEAQACRAVVMELVRYLEEQGWGNDVFAVHLAVEEALVNAMRHGNGNDHTKWIEVAVRVSSHRLRVEITDQGRGFRVEDVPDPTSLENLEKPSGRGLMLMRSFMSRVEFNETGNRVVMEKSRAE